MKLILTSLNIKKDFPDEELFLATEESEVSNDDKFDGVSIEIK